MNGKTPDDEDELGSLKSDEILSTVEPRGAFQSKSVQFIKLPAFPESLTPLGVL